MERGIIMGVDGDGLVADTEGAIVGAASMDIPREIDRNGEGITVGADRVVINRNMSVSDMAGIWLSNNVRGFVRDSGFANYCNHVRRITSYLGECAAAELDRQYVQRFISKLIIEDKLAAGTVRGIVTTLSSIFKAMVEDGFLLKNPCTKLKLPAIAEKEIKVFSRRDQERLQQNILDSQDYRDFGVLICLFTGIRLGELCALRWECVDFKRKMLYIRVSVGRVKDFSKGATSKTRIVETEPKTAKSKRGIPLPAFLYRKLKEMKEGSKSKYIIPSKADDDAPIQPRTMQHVYKRLLARAKLDYVNFHTLRHTFATRCVEQNADIKSLSEILGHSNINITLNRYVHSLIEQKRRLMAGMDLLFSKKRTRTNPMRDIS